MSVIHQPFSGNKLSNDGGFTLLELMVVVSLAAILLGIAIPSFNATIRSNRLTTNANELVTALNIARSEAVKRGQMVVVRKPVGVGTKWENGWQVFVDVDRSTAAFTDNFNDNGNAALCEATEDCLLRIYPAIQATFTLRSTNFPTSITFTPSGQGQINNITTSGNFGICDNRDGNGLPEANTSRLIMVNSTGRVRMGLDANNDGIPNTDNVNSTASNITTCTP